MRKLAAGVTVAKGALAPFRAFLENTLKDGVEVARREDSLLIDGAVTAAGANNDLTSIVARAGPYGAGNPEPVFAIPDHTLVYADEVGTGHIRARLKAPEQAGDYQVRYILEAAGGRRVAVSVPLTVQ